MAKGQTLTATVLKKYEQDLAAEWIKKLKSAGAGKDGRIPESELNSQAAQFISLLQEAAQATSLADNHSPAWRELVEFIDSVSKSRVIQGFSSSETATFIFSFKEPLFDRLRKECGQDVNSLANEVWLATEFLDKLGLIAVQSFQRAREEVINRQQEELLELSTPVVKMWDGILALPMIGTLDSARTQVVMESLLQRIVETGSEIAIIDITGVPTVDTLVAQHLLKTVTAIRLMGADCIISGVRPQIAQTIVHLGVDLQGVTTKANLADALALAFRRTGLTISKIKTTGSAT